ncbi:MAG: hypothetical protein AB1324_06160 [Candidatus Micrarchaeota archaeon]
MAGKQFPMDAVLARLPRLARMGTDFVSLLGIPPGLHEAGDGSLPSFSTDPAVPASSLAGVFFLKLPLPPKVPDFAIGLSEKGGSLYCIIVDKKRKIIANARVGGAHAAEFDWEELGLCIRAALRESESLEAGGNKFRFVLADESGVRAV